MWMSNVYYGYPFFNGQDPEIVFGTTKRSYTMRIDEWLKINHPHLDPLDSDQMLQAGLDTVFKNMNLNVLSDKYKETFIIQFLNEFYMNEIGQETTDYFRQNLNRIIQNHGRYIRDLYEMAEKKFFIEYSYRTTEGTHEETTKSDGMRSVSTTSENSSEHEDSANEKGSNTQTVEETGSTSSNTDITQTSEANSTSHATGNETLSGKDNVVHNNTDSTTYGRTDTHTITDMEDVTTYGKTDTFEYGPNGETNTRSGSETETHNMKHIKEGTENTSGYDEVSGTETNGLSMEVQDVFYGKESVVESYQNFEEYGNTKRTYDNYEVTRNGKNTGIRKLSDTPQNGLEGMGFDEGTGDYGEGGGNYGSGYDTYMSEASVATEITGNKEAYAGSYTDSHSNTKDGTVTRETKYGSGEPEDGSRRNIHKEYESRKTDINRNTTFTGRQDRDDGTITRDYDNLVDKKTGGHSNKATGTDTVTRNGSETNALTGTDKTVTDGNDETNYGRKADTVSDQNTSQDATASQSTESENNTERNSTQTGTNSITSSASGTSSGTSSTDTTDSTENNGKRNGSDSGVEEIYRYNRDAVFMTNDITDKIWSLFDDCFMQVL